MYRKLIMREEAGLRLALQTRNWIGVRKLIKDKASLTYTCTYTPAPLPLDLSGTSPSYAMDDIESAPFKIEEREIIKFLTSSRPCISDIRELSRILREEALDDSEYSTGLTVDKQTLELAANSTQNKHLALLTLYFLTSLSLTGIAGWNAPLIMSFSAITATATLYLGHNCNFKEFYQDACISFQEKVLEPINSITSSKNLTISHAHTH